MNEYHETPKVELEHTEMVQENSTKRRAIIFMALINVGMVIR